MSSWDSRAAADGHLLTVRSHGPTRWRCSQGDTLQLLKVQEGAAAAAAAAAKSLQSCPTLCDPIDGRPPGSPVPGILQARTLEWVAISFSNAWKWKVKVKLLSCVQLLATPRAAAYQAPPPMGFPRQEYWSGMPSPSPQEGAISFISACVLEPEGATNCDRSAFHFPSEETGSQRKRFAQDLVNCKNQVRPTSMFYSCLRMANLPTKESPSKVEILPNLNTTKYFQWSHSYEIRWADGQLLFY